MVICLVVCLGSRQDTKIYLKYILYILIQKVCCYILVNIFFLYLYDDYRISVINIIYQRQDFKFFIPILESVQRFFVKLSRQSQQNFSFSDFYSNFRKCLYHYSLDVELNLDSSIDPGVVYTSLLLTTDEFEQRIRQIQ